MTKGDIIKELQEWIYAEERAGRSVDMERINERLQIMMERHNSTPRADFNGLSPRQMDALIRYPFGKLCAVEINKLTEEQYQLFPLVRQVLFIMDTLAEKELKLTQNGWLPLKIVAAAYSIGSPDHWIEEGLIKRINEYDAKSVWYARTILERLGWTKIRKGMLSLTAKGKNALTNIADAANDIVWTALRGGTIHFIDSGDNPEIGNEAIGYSVWLLNKFGTEWHKGGFYQEQYRKVVNTPDCHNIYFCRVFERLFYWLGIADIREDNQSDWRDRGECRSTELLTILFTFNE